MPINEFSTPLQYEYKPLNLQAFAAPLSKMQEQFDLTQAAIEDARGLFDIKHLDYGTDPEKAKKLIEQVQAKTDELSKNLLETKNYRQAATKIKQLQQLWQKDPELTALESNYKTWLERDKEERERIDNGKDNAITRDQYLQWKAEEIRRYEEKGGASFKADSDNPKGTYNIVTGSTGRLADLQDKFEDLSFKIANAVQGDSYETDLKLLGIDPTTLDAHFKKSKVDVRSKEKVTNAVRDYMMTLPEFQDWGRERAKYNYLDLQYGQNPEKLGQLVNVGLQSVDDKIERRLARLKQVKGNKDEDPKYKALLEEKASLEKMAKTGEVDHNVLQGVYTENFLRDMYTFDELGKTFAYRKTSSEDKFVDTPTTSTSPGGSIFDPTNTPFLLPDKDAMNIVPTITKNIVNDGKLLYANSNKINNLLGGTMRTIVMGPKNNRAGIDKDPAEQYRRQMVVLDAISNPKIKDAMDMRTFLNNQGMSVGVKEAAKLFQESKNQNSQFKRELIQYVQGGKSAYVSYTANKEEMNNLQSSVFADKQVQTVAKDFGLSTPLDLHKDSPQYKLFNPWSYSKEQLKAAGIDYKNDLLEKGVFIKVGGGYGKENHKVLTFEQVAKLNGFKNIEDAIKKGYNFKGAKGFYNYELDPNATELKKNFLMAEGNLTAQEMGAVLLNYGTKKGATKNSMVFNVLNNPETSQRLDGAFKDMNAVVAYAGPTAFAGQPGFTEDGAIETATRTKDPVILQVHGNKLFFGIPYKDTKTGKVGTLTVPLGTRADDFGTQELERIVYETQRDESELGKQTNKTLKNVLFTQKFGDAITQQRADMFASTPGGKDHFLGNITISYGTGVVEAKAYKKAPEKNGTKPTYVLKYANGQESEPFPSVDALRVYVIEHM